MAIPTELSLWLSDMPRRVSGLLLPLPPALLRRRPAAGGFCALEHACHLADLEEEYALRLQRLLAEQAPVLPDFDGDRIARERRYLEQEPGPAVERFGAVRAQTVSLLSGLGEAQLARSGTQEHVGPIDVARLAAAMREHDLAHLEELRALLAELGATEAR